METKDIIMKNFSDMLEVMYNVLKDIIIANDSFIDLRDIRGKDKIYSLEFVYGGEVAEWQVLAVCVENNRVYYCAAYECDMWDFEKYLNKPLDEIGEWFDLKDSDNYYIQTLYNIYESISQYGIKE